MASPIDFYFDFGSPYGYVGSRLIDDLAARHGRSVTWRPIMLGAAMKLTGAPPLTASELKRNYTRFDVERLARRWGVPLRWPPKVPLITLAAARAHYWLADSDSALALRLTRALLHAHWVDSVDIGPAEAVVAIAGPLGIDTAALAAALQDPAVKERLKAETERSIERGVFGSPFFIVDDEPFWGVDKLGLLAERLAGAPPESGPPSA